MGRPTKYTDALADAICADIARGNTFRVAALVNGIDETTFYDWRKRFPQFSQQVDQAEARAEREVVRMLELKIHEGVPDMIKFYLTHRRPDGWRPPKEQRELSGAVEQTVLVRTEFARDADDRTG